ncbi:hypothetical protein C8R30_101146 [Nitrosomonas nitrosa]|uniref:hypothetical protein n=1 Tax=Nitrosomonas nitrosa TaxID=52442 RepID=UPI000D438A74|nr:hypothetical protein [Nitrosomonas nitrosa]PTR04949.1 hypothetical protein C8R30_101146 [Nitrosomonas nitrosa]
MIGDIKLDIENEYIHLDVIDIKEENSGNSLDALESIEKNGHTKPLPEKNNALNRISKGQNFRDEKLNEKLPPDFNLKEFLASIKDDEGDSHSIPEKYKHLKHQGINGGIEDPYDPFAVPDVGIGKVRDLPQKEYNPNDKKLSLAELLEHED